MKPRREEGHLYAVCYLAETEKGEMVTGDRKDRVIHQSESLPGA